MGQARTAANVTTVSGDAEYNTSKINATLVQLIFSPATGSTTYNMELTDPNGIEIYNKTGMSGDWTLHLDIPVVGIYTISISSASADEDFSCWYMFQQ